ncbi:hypothetical protein ACGFXC_09085 [Streptomyces sp. NPDC048507]|uniref:hypothetical protein n=1 Tax=Streptomyces sp. NPDC048507 TaxID=3365560 RepID=UPI00371712A2
MSQQPPPWPFNIADPVRAIHFALDPDCPYADPKACPTERTARTAVQAYETWAAARRPRSVTVHLETADPEAIKAAIRKAIRRGPEGAGA